MHLRRPRDLVVFSSPDVTYQYESASSGLSSPLQSESPSSSNLEEAEGDEATSGEDGVTQAPSVETTTIVR